MMRIVIIANNIMELGGAQRVVHQLADGLSGHGHDVTAVGIVPHETPHAYPGAGHYATTTLLDRPYPKGDRTAEEQRATSALQSILDAGAPGIIICAQLWAMEHLIRCRLDGWRVIGQYHSSYEAAAAGRDLDRAMRVYRDVDAFALLTEADAAAFARHGFMNTVTMPNAVAFRPQHSAALTAPVVTYLGRLSAEKGPRFLVDAWRLLSEVHPVWRLQFIGSGPLADEIAASIAGEDLRIDLLPPTDDPMGALLNSSVLALPSLTEGFPLTLAEAMACGVGSVASDCSSGVRALITDEVNGLLARRGDSTHLAAQLDRLMNDFELRRRLGAAARASVERLDPAVILDRWEQLLVEVCR